MHRNSASLLLFCVISCCAPLASWAVPITVPTDLLPGDTYRLVFVTSTTRDATSAASDDYNDFVTAVANGVTELAALGTTWTAIASTPGDDAWNNTGTNPYNDGTGVPIYRLDDTRVANDNDDLWDGNLQAPIETTETGGGPPSPSYVWTGTGSDGTAFAANPLGNDDFDYYATYGSATATSFWIEYSEDVIFEVHSFFAISGELTVVPEPSTMCLMCFGTAGVVIWQHRRRRHRKT